MPEVCAAGLRESVTQRDCAVLEHGRYKLTHAPRQYPHCFVESGCGSPRPSLHRCATPGTIAGIPLTVPTSAHTRHLVFSLIRLFQRGNLRAHISNACTTSNAGQFPARWAFRSGRGPRGTCRESELSFRTTITTDNVARLLLSRLFGQISRRVGGAPELLPRCSPPFLGMVIGGIGVHAF